MFNTCKCLLLGAEPFDAEASPPGGSELKGLRNVDFAVLVQFLCYTYTKCSCKTIRKISNEFYQVELTTIIILVIF